MDLKLASMQAKMDAITGVYDDLHEKMHEIDKTRKNNLLFYGIKPDFLPEIPMQLENKVRKNSISTITYQRYHSRLPVLTSKNDTKSSIT